MLMFTVLVGTALVCFTAPQELEGDRPSPLERGLAAEAAGDHETAAASYTELLDVPGEHSSGDRDAAALGLARAALEMKDGEGARKALDRLSGGARSRPEAQGLRAAASFLEGRIREAEEGFTNVLKSGPSAEAEYFLGVILFDRGRRAEALQRFEAAIRINPDNYYARIYRARSLLELHRVEEARSCLEELVRSHATPEAHFLSGKALLRLGKPLEAASSFERALAANPDYAEALFNLGAAWRQSGKAPEAKRALDRFSAIHGREAASLRKLDAMHQESLRNPADAGFAEALARESLAGGDVEAAERHAWRALRVDPDRAPARMVLARSFVRSGRYSMAALHYQRVLSKEPGHVEARRELADLVEKHAKKRQE